MLEHFIPQVNQLTSKGTAPGGKLLRYGYLGVVMLKLLGRTDVKITAIGIGTWQMKRDDNSVQVIRKGIEAGSNFVDTAELYRNEDMIGKAVADLDDVFVATKVSPTHFRYEKVLKACDGSLRRLGVKQIDLYQLHWPNPHIPIEETMRAMERLVDEGKIRYIGVSNFDLDELQRAQESMKRYEIVSNQVEYSPFVRYIEKDLLSYCEKEKISVIAYSPLKHGHALESLSRERNPFAQLAESRKATVPQIILRWLISKGNVIAIPKTSHAERVVENVRSQDIELSDSDIHELDEYASRLNSRSTKDRLGGITNFVLRFFR